VGLTQLVCGDLTAALPALEAAFDHPGGAGDDVRAEAAATLALAHAVAGEPAQSRLWMNRGAAATSTRTDPRWTSSLRGKHDAAGLLLALERLDLAAAARSYDALLDHPLRDELWPYVTYARTQYALLAGTPADVLGELDRDRARHDGRLGPGGIAGPLLVAAEANLLLALDRGTAARDTLNGAHRAHPVLRVTHARLALLSGAAEEALHLARDAAWERSASARLRREMLLIEAVAALRTDRGDLALTAAKRAADAIGASGGVRALLSVPREDLIVLGSRVTSLSDLLDHPGLIGRQSLYPAEITLVRLTERERDVLGGLASGLTVQQIAQRSFVSYNTVRTQQRSLYRKLGTSSRSEAVTRARQWGLLPTECVGAAR
jgi:LuxR family maltose regulon positive regulatory protein